MLKYMKPERIFLREHPEYDERWLQKLIADEPSILGLGDIVLLTKEVIQPTHGRLDLLLRDPSSNQRYEVEIQLGRTDETHIIRTIEYWDIERKRYPQYDHTAVIVAEDITSRFLKRDRSVQWIHPLSRPSSCSSSHRRSRFAHIHESARSDVARFSGRRH